MPIRAVAIVVSLPQAGLPAIIPEQRHGPSIRRRSTLRILGSYIGEFALGILLIENTLQAREAGMSREEALLHACPERLRPILMTAFSAMLGMVPIALRGELEAPMAVAVIGGLFASTMLTLLVVPLAYVLFDNIESRLRKRPSDA